MWTEHDEVSIYGEAEISPNPRALQVLHIRLAGTLPGGGEGEVECWGCGLRVEG
jgi:hypothetical protein